MNDCFDFYIRNWYGQSCLESMTEPATDFLLRIDRALNGTLNDQGNIGGVPGGRSFLPATHELATAVLCLASAAGLHVPNYQEGGAQ
jgi:hypothetical protein